MRRLLIVRDADALAAAGAEEFARSVQSSSGPFRVALSGGSTPRTMFELLAAEPFRSRIAWDRIHFFWGDERCVPPDHGDSNYRLASETLLSKVSPAGIHRVPAELSDPDEAARRYSEILQRELGNSLSFDFVFLGMGADGHTASLFPGTESVREAKKSVCSVFLPEKKSHRITLTLPVLNAAKKVVFLVAGADKAETAHLVIDGEPDERRPASLVRPTNGEPLWMLDWTAASRLAQPK